MRIFEFETPVMEKIKTLVEAREAEGKIPADQEIAYLDYEPDQGFIHDADYDGAVAVYGAGGTNIASQSVDGGNQVFDETLRVDLYGFGDPVPKDSDPTQHEPTVKQAQIRAQVLAYLAYNAIMDRQETAGSAVVEKGFGVDFDYDLFPVSFTKFSPMGTMKSRRGAVIYRFDFRFNVEEPTITEALGLPFAGSDNIDSETYDPGTQPE